MRTHVLPRKGSLKTCNITYQTPFEETISPVDLPNSEPATSQYIWTVAAGDLPAFSMTPKSVKYIGCFYAGGRNISGGAATVSWRMIKNGSSVNTNSTSVTNNYYWTLSAAFYDIAVGDVLELRLWSSAASGHNRSYQARAVSSSRLFLTNTHDLLRNFTVISSLAMYPTLTGGDNFNGQTYAWVDGPNTTIQIFTSPPKVMKYWKHSTTYGLYRAYFGDSNNSNNGTVQISSSNLPYYYVSQYLPISMSFWNLGVID